MSIKAWPFLVSRNKRVGYSTVLTPDFVLKANATNLLANAAGDEKTKLGVVFYREIHDSRVGSIGLLFRIVNAKDKKGNFLKDALGRSIEKIEGWVFDQTFPSTSIGISDQEMDLAHRLVEPIFNLFWEIGDKNFMQSSEATVIQEITNTNLLLEIVRLEPYVTVKPKEKNFVSDVIKQDDGKQKRSKDLTRKPDKLISRSPFGTGQWKHSQFRVEGPIAELAFIPSTRYVAVLHTNFRYLSVVNCIKGTKKVSATKLYNQANFGGISVNSKGQLAIVNNPPYLSPKNHSEVWFLSTSFDNDAPTSHLDRLISSIKFSPTDRWLACGTKDGHVFIWDVEKSEWTLQEKFHKTQVTSLSFSANGRYLTTSSKDGDLCLIDLTDYPNYKILFTEENKAINSVCISPNGHLIATGGSDFALRVWEVKTGREIIVEKSNKDGINSLIFSPREDLLAVGSDDKTVRLWDIVSWKQKEVFLEQSGGVKSVVFNERGNILVSGSDDGVIDVWQNTS